MRTLKTTAAAVALAALLGSTGCYGSYSASTKLHKWNGRVTGDKFANSAIQFGLIVIPVYPLLLLGDFLIFNTVEVLTGDNPIE